MYEGTGDQFQEKTTCRRGELPRGKLDWANRPDAHKGYPLAPRVALSDPQTTGGATIWDVKAHRRSVRRFQDTPLTEAELSQLLWAAQGITRWTEGYAFRTSPSAGALYPVETYVVIHSVGRIEPGVYHYVVEDHVLEQLGAGPRPLGYPQRGSNSVCPGLPQGVGEAASCDALSFPELRLAFAFCRLLAYTDLRLHSRPIQPYPRLQTSIRWIRRPPRTEYLSENSGPGSSRSIPPLWGGACPATPALAPKRSAGRLALA